MHDSPRLTIGIPTIGARPERLERAIGSALAQATPAFVMVCDQGGSEAVAGVAEKYSAHPLVRRVESPAGCLWENWCWAAASCETEFFAWLQDDDVVAPHFARRVVGCFDAFPAAVVYIARLGISLTCGLANWWQSTGPMVPMDLIHGGAVQVRGDLLIGGAYFTSHALSPGVAFRVGPETIAACRRVPPDADLFAERSVLAELGALGHAVCDPAIVGYWVHHEGNESRKQNLSGDGGRQYKVMLAHIDGLIERHPRWQEPLRGWGLMAGDDNLRHWLDTTERFAGDSPHLDAGRAVLKALLPAPAAPPPAAEHATSRKARRAERR